MIGQKGVSHMEKLNVQMYSLGWGNTDPMPESFKKLAAMGYTGVEFAGSNYGGMSVEEMKQKPYLAKWLEQGFFERYLFLRKKEDKGREIKILNERLEWLC